MNAGNGRLKRVGGSIDGLTDAVNSSQAHKKPNYVITSEAPARRSDEIRPFSERKTWRNYLCWTGAFLSTAGLGILFGILIQRSLDSQSDGSTFETDMSVEPKTRPNILVLLIDDAGQSDISFTGAEYSTPNIDEIFTDGVHYSKFYTYPICTPSRSSFLSGRLTWKTGLQYPTTFFWWAAGTLAFEDVTIGTYLKESGYSTGYYGRWALGAASAASRPLQRGYDTFLGWLSILDESYYNTKVTSFAVTDPAGDLRNSTVNDFWDGEDAYFPQGVYNDVAIQQRLLEDLDQLPVNTDGDSPWHIFWSPQTIHDDIGMFLDPLPLAYEECEATTRNTYCTRMKYLDELFGEVTGKIKERGEWDNTLIFLASDNGAAQVPPITYDDGSPGETVGTNFPYKGGKFTYYEGGIRVLGAIGGGWLPEELRGTVDNNRHHSVDFAATIVDVAGTNNEARQKMDGKNLFVDGENHNGLLVLTVNPIAEIAPYPTPMDPVPMGTVIFKDNWKYIAALNNLNYNPAMTDLNLQYTTGVVDVRGVLTFSDTDEEGGWGKCWETDDGGHFLKGCLFDIDSDPYETTNVWDDNPDVVQQMQNRHNDAYFSFDYHGGHAGGVDLRALEYNVLKMQDFGESGWKAWLWPWLDDGGLQVETEGLGDWEFVDYDITIW